MLKKGLAALCALLGLVVFSILLLSAASLESPHYPADRRADAKAKESAEQDTPLAHFGNWVTSDAVSFFTFVLATIGAVQLFTVIVQFKFLIRADRTANISARAARDAADTASDTAKRQLRSYVHVSGGEVYNLEKAGGRFAILEIKNFGQTPARDLRVWTGIHVREWPLVTVLPQRDDLARGVENLPPQRPSVFRLRIGELSEFEERALRNGDAAVYIWGRVTYRDVFGKDHFTNIRFACEGESLPEGAIHATEVGNEAD